MNTTLDLRGERHKALWDAQVKAEGLFKEIDARKLVRAGISERQLNQEVYDLAFEMYGIKKYWHKRIVRAGKNTLCPYKENPPDLIIQPHDIMFFDFGPVFEDWEADLGKTYVLGDDPKKLKLKHDIEECWYLGKNFFDTCQDITGSRLFEYVSLLARDRGWSFGPEVAGHLIGNFPHERIQGDEICNYIHRDNHELMNAPDKNGSPRDWILEIHFIDKECEIGGFFEQLLTVNPPH